MSLREKTKGLARKSREKAARSTTWVLPLGALLCVVILQISNFSWVNWMRHRAFDAFQQLKPREYVDAGVRIIDLDDATLAKIGQWPWPRTQVARLERRLQELGAAATVYDVFFSEPDRTSPRALAAGLPSGPEFAGLKERLSRLPDNDAVLARALREGRSVLGLALTTETNAVVISTKGAVSISSAKPEHIPKLNKFPGAVTNIPILDQAAGGLGNVGFSSELDQSIRKSPLFFSRAGRIVPALAVEGLRVAQGASRVGLKLAGGSGEITADESGNERDVVLVKIGDITTPTERDSSLWIYYTSPEESKRRVIPAWRLFEKGFDPAQVEGTICFIGTSATGLKDLRVTPLNPAAAGVEVHANLAEQMLTGTFLKKPDWAPAAEISYLLVLGLLLLFLLERVGALYSAPIALAAVAGSLGMSWYGFTAHRFLIDPVLPFLGLFSVYTTWTAVTFVKTEDAKRRITGTFGRYLSPKVVEKLASNPGDVELGGETREMTFHFCDVRGFTTISEKFDPHGLTVFINKFLTPMTEIILAHDGTIDKYIGDCIMAFWNAPMNVPNHAARACEAALKMHERLAELNEQWQDEAKTQGIDLPRIEIGTGLNTGPAVVGNMGSSLRVDYTVLGDDVNLASRLEGQSKTYGVSVVIGPGTREQAPAFAAIELDLIKVKGKTRPVNIYALLGAPSVAKSGKFKELEAAHKAFLGAYRGARFDEAENLLAKARGLGEPYKLGHLYDLYAGRIADYKARPPESGWDGVFTATSK